MSSELVTVCLSAYNAEPFIGRAIESVLAQTHSNFRLFVVNDASTDDTLFVAKKYLSDPRVHIVNLSKNIGTYAAKNLVLKNFAEGEYWAHHDADDFSEPTRFEKQIAFLKEKNLDGCGTAIDEIYYGGVKPRIPAAEAELRVGDDGLPHRLNQYAPSFTLEDLTQEVEDLAQLKIAMNGSLLFKLDALKALGGFDGTTPVAGDTELLWRFIMFYKFGNMPGMLYHRSFHAESLTQQTATGYNSDFRQTYVKNALQRFQKRVVLYNARNVDEARKESTYTMQYPDVPFELLHV